MTFWSSVRAARLQCLRASSQICCGRLCMELDFIISHAIFIGRLCTELDNINAHLIADVLVVCGRSSTSLFVCKLSDFMQSSACRAQRSKNYEPKKFLKLTIRILMKA